MDTNDSENRLAEILDARHGRSAVEAGVDHPDLVPDLEVIDLIWEAQQDAPSLEDDPTARMLGLVVDPKTTFDGKAALAARKRSGLSVSALAAKLVARGWDVTSQDVFAWERNSTSLAPALVRAIAEEIGATSGALVRVTGVDPERERMRAIFALPEFVALAARWARAQGTTLSLATAALEARTLAAVHRGGAPEPDVVLKSLEALVEVLEGDGRAT